MRPLPATIRGNARLGRPVELVNLSTLVLEFRPRLQFIPPRLGLAQHRFAARRREPEHGAPVRGGTGRPRAETLERIAQLGGVSVDWLLRGDRRRPEGPREWDDAVRLLRVAWRRWRREFGLRMARLPRPRQRFAGLIQCALGMLNQDDRGQEITESSTGREIH
jgi:hypothetical protein